MGPIFGRRRGREHPHDVGASWTGLMVTHRAVLHEGMMEPNTHMHAVPNVSRVAPRCSFWSHPGRQEAPHEGTRETRDTSW
jgi:hypothetical protein